MATFARALGAFVFVGCLAAVPHAASSGAALAAELPPTGPAAPVAAPLPVSGSTAPLPTAAGLQESLGRLSRTGRSAALVVVDPGTGDVLLERLPATPLIPASTAKLATAAAALHVLGPDYRIPTSVSSEDGVLYLVGGGDPSLRIKGKQAPGEPASLAALARATADALAPGASLDLVYDDRAFRGPELGPGWPVSFPRAGVVPPITALIVDGGRVSPGATSRVGDPARQAAEIFAGQLRREGLTVTSVAKGKVGDRATQIAQVESPRVADLVEHMLTQSDNGYAESLGHLVGGKHLGQPTFAGGAKATKEALTQLGIDVDGYGLRDASGLSRRNLLAARSLTDILESVATGERPTLSWIAPGLAVAGLTGTLAERFQTPATSAGKGVVQAKTGTLTGVSALAGLVTTADGRLLAFAHLQNGVDSLVGARDRADRIAATIAQCGCR